MSFSIEQLWHRILHVIGRGRGTGVGDDSGNVQKQQVVFSGLETQSELKRLGEYGHASMPPDGFDCVAVFIGGDRGNGMIIATGHQASRLKNLLPGESALYDDLGKVIALLRDQILVDAKGVNFTVQNCPLADFDNQVNAGVSYMVNGVKVVGEQMPPIIPPAGGGTIDAEARASIDAIIATLQTHGLTL